ncbi:MAG: HlyD family efflux transporter periplasmic adaptor subunit [Verrucomicrobia bacterium]|nr:HlyD family efflux transporter periplasmic adaptor subunit [Verrucomicrobiota bacterium]MDA1047082.1 HlyD family efflux transporter periplasmic adaptor subunit [Verrucomicrobiota bacterium]
MIPKIKNLRKPRRRGFATAKAVIGLASGGAVVVAWWLLAGGESEEVLPEALFEQVVRKEFRLEIVEPGEIESAHNVDVLCEVKSRNSVGVNILEIVPEGSQVKEGDFLVRLDDSALQKDLLTQRIDVHQAKAVLVQAEADVEAATLAMDEYLSGSYRQDLQQLEGAVFVARENLRRAQEYHDYSKKLAIKGYISETQLGADAFAVEKSRKDLDLSLTKLDVLRVHSRKAKVNDLNASILTAEARLLSRRNSYELEVAQEAEIEEQISKCLIKAPASGEVTYANRTSSSSDGILIEAGRPVRERQAIIRLPDPSNMRVIAKVNESRVEQVEPGMPVDISIFSSRKLVLHGRVVKVGDYPIPSASRYTAHIKEYATEILIENPPDGLRPGMTAKVSILVEQIPSALQIPLHAVLRVKGTSYCLAVDELGDFQARAVRLGSANDASTVVESGLSEGEQVVVNASEFRDIVTFSDNSSSGQGVALVSSETDLISH